jgi:hypothetical protein
MKAVFLAGGLDIRSSRLRGDEGCANTFFAFRCAEAHHVNLCLSLFDWAVFCKAKAAVKLHTMLDLRSALAHSHQRRHDREVRCLLSDG